MSIATAILAAQAKVAAAYTECNAKGATMPSAANQDLAHLDDTIASIPTGGGITPAPSKDVNFYDYEGTILYSYTKAEFLALSAMPANPDRTSEGLTAQGWNWSLADAQDYVRKYRMIDIGQTYITTDGDTKLFITIATKGRMAVPLYLVVSGEVTIDWGDGSTVQTVTSSDTMPIVHNYSNVGDYVISLHIVSGTLELSQNDTTSRIIGSSADIDGAYRAMLTKVFVGDAVKINQHAFLDCYFCTSIVLGIHNATLDYWGRGSSLTHVTLAQGIGTKSDGVEGSALQSISPSKTSTISTQSIHSMVSLKRLCVSLARNNIATNCLRACSSLGELVIPDIITECGNEVCNDLKSLAKLHMTSATPPTIVANFLGGSPSDLIIYVPYSSDHSVLAAYQGATNWSAHASQMVEETEV